MILWHQHLIEYLPVELLYKQHKDCCVLRSQGWGLQRKNYKLVNYVFDNPYYYLYYYHCYIMDWINYHNTNIINININYVPFLTWYDLDFRGLKVGHHENDLIVDGPMEIGGLIYKEHDEKYMSKCLKILIEKDILIPEILNWLTK